MNGDAIIIVALDNAGDIAITGQNISLLSEDNVLWTGIFVSGSSDSQAGDVVLDASDNIDINGGDIFNHVSPGRIGNSGHIEIKTSTLTLSNGARLLANTSTSSEGNAGNVIITANDRITFDGDSIVSTSIGTEGFSYYPL